jgi:hypothetical protein
MNQRRVDIETVLGKDKGTQVAFSNNPKLAIDYLKTLNQTTYIIPHRHLLSQKDNHSEGNRVQYQHQERTGKCCLTDIHSEGHMGILQLTPRRP